MRDLSVPFFDLENKICSPENLYKQTRNNFKEL